MNIAVADHLRNGHAIDPFGMTLPHDLDAERSLLCSMMLDTSTVEDVGNIVGSVDFHAVANALIYRAIVSLHTQGVTPNAEIVYAELKRFEKLDDIGGLDYLLQVSEAEPHAGNAVYYAETVRKLSLRRQMTRRAQDIMVRAQDEAVDPRALIAESVTTFEKILSNASTEPRFKLMNGPELLAKDYTQNYLVDGILVEGQPCIIGGPSKALKTTLAVDLFVALTIGGMFLGKFKVHRRCRTLLMSGESGEATIAETVQRVLDAAGYGPEAIADFHLCTKLPQLSSAEQLIELGAVLRRNEIDVLAIDPIYLCMSPEGVSNVFAQGEALGRVSELCQEHNVTPILIHHVVRKAGTTYEPIELTDLAFSGYSEWARQWVLIGRREKFEPGTGEHRLWLTAGGSAGHNGLWAIDASEGAYAPGVARYWDVAVRSPDDARKGDSEQKADARRAKKSAESELATKAVAEHLAKQNDTMRGVREGTGLSKNAAEKCVAALLDSGTITRAKVMKNKRLEDGFALKTEGQSNE